MTCKEKAAEQYPFAVGDEFCGGVSGCPSSLQYRYADPIEGCDGSQEKCTECWNREIPETEEKKTIYAHILSPEPNANRTSFPEGVKLEPTIVTDKDGNTKIIEVSIVRDDKPRILDSGNRREFASGAVRDIQEGKGRCDLLPLDVVADYLNSATLGYIANFQDSGDTDELLECLHSFQEDHYFKSSTMLLEVSIHFEEGAKKYGDNNWRKGIDVRCYIDSAVRHYLKFLRGDKDEPHDRAFCWNILCAIWTCKHHPELNEYGHKEEE